MSLSLVMPESSMLLTGKGQRRLSVWGPEGELDNMSAPFANGLDARLELATSMQPDAGTGVPRRSRSLACAGAGSRHATNAALIYLFVTFILSLRPSING